MKAIKVRELIRPRLATYGFRIEEFDDFEKVIEWCLANIGEPKKTNGWFYKKNFWHHVRSKDSVGYGCVYFTSEINAAAFKLKWL